MASVLSQKHFHNEDEAFAYVEARVWPEGPVCPHCGGVERISKMQGKSTRKGLYKCYQCRKPFTVRMGTIFESSKVQLHIWLQAMYLVAGSKKGISSHQLARTRATVRGRGSRPLRRSKTKRGSPKASLPNRVGVTSLRRRNISTSLSKCTAHSL